MNSLDSMLERNKDFAAQQSAEGTLMPSLPRALPNVKAIIIGCADMRVDPAHVLGIKPGEAVVIRNIGGRITPGLLEQLSLLAHYFQIQEGELKQKAVTDPRAAVAGDVTSLRAIPALPGEWLISGLVYDVATGLVEIVVPPAAIRTVSISLDQGRSSGLSRVA
jgi:carbonic anhydrase